MANLTKKAIAASVERLLEKKPLDRITIKEITDDCGMTRNTFYYHFQDIYDLCRWIFITQADEITGRYKGEAEWSDGFRAGLEYLYEHKRMIRHVYDSINRGDLDRYLAQVTSKYAMELIGPRADEMGICGEARELAAEFYRNAFVAKILQWISRDMDTAPETLARMCDCIFRGTIDGALKSAQEVTEDLQN